MSSYVRKLSARPHQTLDPQRGPSFSDESPLASLPSKQMRGIREGNDKHFISLTGPTRDILVPTLHCQRIWTHLLKHNEPRSDWVDRRGRPVSPNTSISCYMLLQMQIGPQKHQLQAFGNFAVAHILLYR